MSKGIKTISPKYFHVYNRGANGGKIFSTSENYFYLIRQIAKFIKHYQIDILAFCLMPNHYHFMFRELLQGDVSRFIQRLFNSYTQAYNKQQNRYGTLFQGRMKKKYVESRGYALELVRYIHRNPVRAGLVRDPLDWAFSSHAEWMGIPGPELCDPDFRSWFFETLNDYEEFILTPDQLETLSLA
jgi:REP element-mobilizing transposase RayT